MNLQEALAANEHATIDKLNKLQIIKMLPLLASREFCLQEKGNTFAKAGGDWCSHICTGNASDFCDYYTMLSPVHEDASISGDWEHYSNGTVISLNGASSSELAQCKKKWLPLPIVAEYLNVSYEGLTSEVVNSIHLASQMLIEGGNYLDQGTEIEAILMGW